MRTTIPINSYYFDKTLAPLFFLYKKIKIHKHIKFIYLKLVCICHFINQPWYGQWADRHILECSSLKRPALTQKACSNSTNRSCKVIPLHKHSKNTHKMCLPTHTHTHTESALMDFSAWPQYSHHCCWSGRSRVKPAEGEDGCFISTTGMERGRERRTERRERKSRKVGQRENVISHKTNDTSSGRVSCPTAPGSCISSSRDHHHAVFRFVS